MKAVSRIFAFSSLVIALLGAPALAAGPVDGELGAVWWSNDLEADTGVANSETDGSAPGFRGELWLFERYGVRGTQYSSESDMLGTGDAEYTAVDLMWRAFAPSENNFLAVGLGWQEIGLESIGMEGDTSGMRISLEGRVGFMDTVYAYGQGSYLPALEETASNDPLGDQVDDLDGYEYELGVGWNVAPFFSIRGGYRVNEIAFTQSAIQTSTATTFVQGNGGGVTGLTVGSQENAPAQNAVNSNSGTMKSDGYFVGAAFRF